MAFLKEQIIELVVRSVTSVKLCVERSGKLAYTWMSSLREVGTTGWIRAVLRMSCMSQENKFHFLSFFRCIQGLCNKNQEIFQSLWFLETFRNYFSQTL